MHAKYEVSILRFKSYGNGEYILVEVSFYISLNTAFAVSGKVGIP